MWHGTSFIVEFSPAGGAITEIIFFLSWIFVTAFLTVIFLTYVNMDNEKFVYFGIIGPFVSLWTPVLLTPNGALHPAFLVLSLIFTAGFLLGVAAHRFLSRL